MRRRVSVAVCVLASAGCTYDFDSAFSSGSGGAGGTASGTATGTSSGTSSGTASGTNTGMTGSENCFNQVDDDDDGLVDCEDEDCTNGTCVAPAPEGWEIATVALAKEGEPLPECGSEWAEATEANNDLISAAASCTSCTCGDPGYACSEPTITSYTNPNCSVGSEDQVAVLADGMCTTIVTNDFDGFVVSVPQASGSCPPSGGQATLPPVTWGERGRVCAGGDFGAGCGADVCAPVGPGPASCIAREGDELCPDEYSEKTLLYQGHTDARGCSDCSCAPEVTCTGELQVYLDQSSCLGAFDFDEVADGLCTTVSRGDAIVSIEYNTIMTPSPCSAGGGQPTGTVTPAEPITVCCPGPGSPAP